MKRVTYSYVCPLRYACEKTYNTDLPSVSFLRNGLFITVSREFVLLVVLFFFFEESPVCTQSVIDTGRRLAANYIRVVTIVVRFCGARTRVLQFFFIFTSRPNDKNPPNCAVACLNSAKSFFDLFPSETNIGFRVFFVLCDHTITFSITLEIFNL